MNLDEWRALQVGGEEAELPSGLVVKLRRAGVMDLAGTGKIPTTLQPQLDRFINRTQQGVTMADVEGFAPLMALVCQACIMEPAGLDVAELPYSDQMAIFKWANEGSNKLQTFRGKQGKPLEFARNGGDVLVSS